MGGKKWGKFPIWGRSWGGGVGLLVRNVEGRATLSEGGGAVVVLVVLVVVRGSSSSVTAFTVWMCK